jgi:large subunit ribosomal protein L15
MMIHDITKKTGRHRRRVRVGRGEASGLGKTSGRGHKGAASRSGWSLKPQYQGGQINFIQKMPKRGFNNHNFQTRYAVVNVKALDAFASNGDEITAQSLADAGLIRDARMPLKVLGEGEITKKITVTANRFSASAKAKIEKAGGAVNQIPDMKWSRDGAVEATPKVPLRRRRKAGAAPDPAAAWAERAAAQGKGKSKAKTDKADEADKPAGAAAEQKTAEQNTEEKKD